VSIKNVRISIEMMFLLLKENAGAFLVGLALIAFICFQALNHVVSTKKVSGIFIRWTIEQKSLGRTPTRTLAFIELYDGRTILARVPTAWVPPSANTEVNVEESHFLLGGSLFQIH
jgi:hypothetical protein